MIDNNQGEWCDKFELYNKKLLSVGLTIETIFKQGNAINHIKDWINKIREKNKIKKKLILHVDMLNSIQNNFLTFFPIIEETLLHVCNIKEIIYEYDPIFYKESDFDTIEIESVILYVEIPVNKKEKINELELEFNRVKKELEKCKLKLQNENFIKKAPKNIIIIENKKKDDFIKKISTLEMLIMKYKYKEYVQLILKYGTHNEIINRIQYLREQNTKEELYSENWFNEIYNTQINHNEIIELTCWLN